MPILAPQTGLIAPPFTPFDCHGDLALDVVDRQANHFAETGISGVFVGGTTGEGMSLSTAERRSLSERWAAAGKSAGLTVLLQIGSPSLTATQELAEHAESIGADAIAAVAPFYFRPPTVGVLVEYCAAVARCAPATPFYYYHIPVMTGCTLSPAEFLEQGGEKIPTLRGMKFTDRDLGQLQRCLAVADSRFDVLFGWDEALLAGLSLGIRGAIGCTYNFAASVYRRVLSAFEAGNQIDARAAQAEGAALIDVLLRQRNFLAAAKATMGMVGVECGPPRLPIPALSDEETNQLFTQLEALNLFDLLQPV